MSEDSYTWISTRDGSPTLWNNDLAEPFRNTRGAFTESWETFVQPALKFAHAHPELRPLHVGEFGLGPGTNWILLNVAAQWVGLKLDYFAIEQDLQSFSLGQNKWNEPQIFECILDFLESKILLFDFELLEKPTLESTRKFKNPRVYKDIATFCTSTEKANIWFHDPFGFEVNQDGYTLETLTALKSHLSSPCLGLSYSCHGKFQNHLTSLRCEINRFEYETKIKRERLEFFIP